MVLPQGPTDLDNPRTLCQREGSRPGGAAGISIETQPFPCFKEMENWLGELSLQVSTSLGAAPEIIRKRLEKLTTSDMTPYKGISERDEV